MSPATTRRELLKLSGAAVVTYGSCVTASGLGLSAKVREGAVQELRESLRKISAQPGSLTPPSEVDKWFGRCTVKSARNNQFGSSVHSEFANNFTLEEPADFVLRYHPGTIPVGIHRHPWMGLASYSESLTLNNAEVVALTPGASFFDPKVRLYQDAVLRFAPIPDSVRLDVKAIHLQTFESLVRGANLDPQQFRLHYVRYYIVTTIAGDATLKPRPMIAYGYSKRESEGLKVDLSFLV